jgi:NADPH:quinone reductase-like Zn-dependent oxidoreductase
VWLRASESVTAVVWVQAVYTATGDASKVTEFRSVPIPSIRPSDVLIRVHACALNPIDWCVRV